ncbi:MAG: TonB-dependent receptor domain-containing protein [Gemmatimonadota bacterium]
MRLPPLRWSGRTVLIAAALAAAATPSAGQDGTGRIVGTVGSDETAGPLAGVHVRVASSEISAITDLDGRFALSGVPAGTHALEVRMLGYESKTVTGLRVDAGAVTRMDVTLRTAAIEVAGITVTAARERGSAAFLMDERRIADGIVEAVGSAEISRSPASSAADVAMRMPGLTVTDGRYAFIRGLGERYSQTSLNGSTLPSPEPERNVVPLDLFPAGFLESLSTRKTYSPDMPADFSGGTIAIATRDFPDRLRIRAGIGTSINTMSQFRGGFLTYPGGGLDFLGVDDGTRALPDEATRRLGGMRGERMSSDPAVREAIGRALPRQFSPVESNVPMNRKLDLSIGNRLELFGRELGIVTGLTYSDGYRRQTDRVERKWRASAFDPELPAERREPNVDYTFTTGTRNVRLGAIANLSVLLTPSQKIGLKTTFTRNADDEARRFLGDNREDLGGTIRNERLRFVSRSLYWGQLFGEHRLPLDSRLEWRVNRAAATRDEPGLREAVYIRTFGRDDDPFHLESAGESARYFFGNLRDDDSALDVDWRTPIPIGSDLTASVKTGLSIRGRARDFAARRFYWNFNGSFTDLTSALDPGSIVGHVPRSGELTISEIVEPGDRYRIDETREAAYLMLDLPFTGSLRAVVGARVERYGLDLVSRDSLLADRRRTDLLPALNLVYRPSDRMNLRAAASRTLDAPEFREIAPFQFTEATSLRQIYGNPALDVARIRSADLRWEWFPAPGEVVSLGAFVKRIENPIEQVFFATASTAYSYQNANEATLRGVEFEVRHGLGTIDAALEPFTVQTNVSLIDSEVEVRRSGAFQPTSSNRPLEGQSPYVLNAGLRYAPPESGPEIGVFYNIFGPRLVAAGGSGIPDIYERPRSQLDVTFGTMMPGNARLSIEATNLLDAEYRHEQTANGITLVQKQYRVGRTFSFGLSWTL